MSLDELGPALPTLECVLVSCPKGRELADVSPINTNACFWIVEAAARSRRAVYTKPTKRK